MISELGDKEAYAMMDKDEKYLKTAVGPMYNFVVRT